MKTQEEQTTLNRELDSLVDKINSTQCFNTASVREYVKRSIRAVLQQHPNLIEDTEAIADMLMEASNRMVVKKLQNGNRQYAIGEIYHWQDRDIGSIRHILRERTYTNPDFHKDIPNDGTVLDWVKWLRQNNSMVTADVLVEFIDWAARLTMYAKNTANYGSAVNIDPYGSHIIFDGGQNSGKSHSIDKFVDAFLAFGLPATSGVKPPLQDHQFSVSGHLSSDLLVGFGERNRMKVDVDVLRCVGRHEKISIEYKGQQAIEAPARAITMGSTNGNRYGKGDRQFLRVTCLNIPWCDPTAEITIKGELMSAGKFRDPTPDTAFLSVNAERLARFVEGVKAHKWNFMNIPDERLVLACHRYPEGMEKLNAAFNSGLISTDTLGRFSIAGLHKDEKLSFTSADDDFMLQFLVDLKNKGLIRQVDHNSGKYSHFDISRVAQSIQDYPMDGCQDIKAAIHAWDCLEDIATRTDDPSGSLDTLLTEL